MVNGSKHWPGLRNTGRSRLLGVVLGVCVLTAALAAPLQSAGAAFEPRQSCVGNSYTESMAVLKSSVGYPGEETCFLFWLESGYTYTFKVDSSTHPIDLEFGAPTSSPLTDSVLTVYRYTLPRDHRGYGQEWELVGYNDDISSTDRSSRVSHGNVGPYVSPGEWYRYAVIVGGYSQHTGSFKLSITRSVMVDPEPCRMVWGC